MSLKLQPGPRGQWINATAAPAPPCAPPSTVIQGGSPLLPSWSCQPPSVLRLRATAHAQPSERLREQWPTEVETNLEWLEAVTEHHPGSRKWLWNGKIVLYFENVNQECSGAPRASKTWKRASQQEELISSETNRQKHQLCTHSFISKLIPNDHDGANPPVGQSAPYSWKFLCSEVLQNEEMIKRSRSNSLQLIAFSF